MRGGPGPTWNVALLERLIGGKEEYIYKEERREKDMRKRLTRAHRIPISGNIKVTFHECHILIDEISVT